MLVANDGEATSGGFPAIALVSCCAVPAHPRPHDDGGAAVASVNAHLQLAQLPERICRQVFGNGLDLLVWHAKGPWPMTEPRVHVHPGAAPPRVF